jgi:hypothetical protein
MDGDNIVFKSGAVLPGGDAEVDCFDRRLRLRALQIYRVPNFSALQWDVTIDPRTGRAARLRCGALQ